jgi:hypothetical protein
MFAEVMREQKAEAFPMFGERRVPALCRTDARAEIKRSARAVTVSGLLEA